MLRTLKICRKSIDDFRINDTLRCLKNITTVSNRFCTSDNPSRMKKEKSLLYRDLRSKILACGPISVAEYMKEILTHPTSGYYTTKDMFGRKGDFTTSPEISQLFGELIAVWVINEWRKIYRNPFQLIELGPGKGTLVSHILRVFKTLKLSKSVSIHLVEISPTLSMIQAQNLCTSFGDCNPEESKDQKNPVGYYRKGITDDGVDIYWYYSIKDVPRRFSVFVANEFFDALPIHKFQKTEKGWNEVLIDITEGTDEEKFRFVLSGAPTPATKVYVPADEKRDHIEISPQTIVIIEYMSIFLRQCGGFSLIIDYGHEREKTDTFRAFHQHKLHDPLLNPGTADLTADVDFSLIKNIAQRNNTVLTFGPVSQRHFLKNLGIDVRLRMLLKNASDEQKKRLISGYNMITDADQMGERFKILALFPYILKPYLENMPVAGFTMDNTDTGNNSK